MQRDPDQTTQAHPAITNKPNMSSAPVEAKSEPETPHYREAIDKARKKALSQIKRLFSPGAVSGRWDDRLSRNDDSIIDTYHHLMNKHLVEKDKNPDFLIFSFPYFNNIFGFKNDSEYVEAHQQDLIANSPAAITIRETSCGVAVAFLVYQCKENENVILNGSFYIDITPTGFVDQDSAETSTVTTLVDYLYQNFRNKYNVNVDREREIETIALVLMEYYVEGFLKSEKDLLKAEWSLSEPDRKKLYTQRAHVFIFSNLLVLIITELVKKDPQLQVQLITFITQGKKEEIEKVFSEAVKNGLFTKFFSSVSDSVSKRIKNKQFVCYGMKGFVNRLYAFFSSEKGADYNEDLGEILSNAKQFMDFLISQIDLKKSLAAAEMKKEATPPSAEEINRAGAEFNAAKELMLKRIAEQYQLISNSGSAASMQKLQELQGLQRLLEATKPFQSSSLLLPVSIFTPKIPSAPPAPEQSGAPSAPPQDDAAYVTKLEI